MKIKRNWIVPGLLLVTMMLGTGFWMYAHYINQKLYSESTKNLSEVFRQVNVTFQDFSAKNWKLLGDWGYTISSLGRGDALVEDYLSTIDEAWEFTDLYFIDASGKYIRQDGSKGYINLGRDQIKLMVDKENIVADGTVAGAEQLVIFAVPVEPDNYMDFEFQALAVSYDKSDIAAALNVNFFKGDAECYVTYTDGRILFAAQAADHQPNNYLAYLESADFNQTDLALVREAFRHGDSGTASYTLDGVTYYLYYQPVGFQDWMLLGIVPQNVINASMVQIQRVTILLFGSSFGLLGLTGLLFLLSRNRKSVREKVLELQYREQLFSILANHTDEIFFMLSYDTMAPEYISPNIERLLGVSAENAKEGLLKWSSDLKTECAAQFAKLRDLSPGASEQVETERIHHQTGERIWFMETVFRVSIEESDKYIIILSERSKERQAKQALEDALEIARVANESKSVFLSNMSHDIRTPMNAVVGLSTLLERNSENPDKVREYARKIAGSSAHLLGLINDILDMSKIESGKTTLNISEINLAKLVENYHTIILPQARAKQQNFEISVYDVRSEHLLGDSLRINQIMINLLSNAVKYTQTGGRVDLIIRELPQMRKNYARLQFLVRDNGIGMSEDFINTVFDPFTREVSSIVNQIQGTGLGMAIVKNLLDLMGGTIKVESKKEVGTTFTVELELRIAEQNIDEQFWDKHGISQILVVDDEAEVCTNILAAFSGTSVGMQYAVDGAAAVKMAETASRNQRSFDLVLLDWKMPGMDGIETAREIRRVIPQDTPIMILTAYDWSEIEDRAIDAGIIAFLPKPFFVTNLKQMLEGLNTSSPEYGHVKDDCTSILMGKNFLAAEDNEINAEILCQLLKMRGASVVVKRNGQEVIAEFERSGTGVYDAILMDIQMPVMNGYEAARAIRTGKHPSALTIPIIAMTANAFAEDVRDALNAGMNAHIAKPLDLDRVESVLKDLIDTGT